MNDFYKSPPISAQFSVVRFTVNSQQSTVNSQHLNQLDLYYPIPGNFNPLRLRILRSARSIPT